MERWVRLTLWLSAPFNGVAAALFALPGSVPAQWLGFPAAAPVVYTALTAYLVALFGLAYLWLARARTLDRPMIALFGIGKAGVFLIAVTLAFGGHVGPRLAMLAAGDGAIAAVWLTWLWQQRSGAKPN